MKALIGALIIAIVAAYVVFTFASNSSNQDTSSDKVKVLVASKAIPTGLTLAEVRDQGFASETSVAVIDAPSDALSVITTANQNQVAIAPITQGSVLAVSNFADTLVNSGPLDIPSGMMAVTVDLTDPAHVGSFLRPGSEITIFATSTEKSATGNEQKVTRVLFGRVTVIAVAASTTKEEANAAVGSNGPLLVTVIVTPKQAQKLIHGIATTALYFGLLNGETVVPPSSGVNDQNLFDEVN